VKLIDGPRAGFAESMPYFLIASLTSARGTSPSSASAFRSGDVRSCGHSKKQAQVVARVRAARSSRCPALERRGHVGTDLVGEGAHLVGSGDDRPLGRRKALLE